MISVNFRKNDPAFPRLLAKKLNDLQSNIAGKSDIGHTHEIADVTGLQTALDGKVSTETTIAGVNLQDSITKAELLAALNVEDGADDNVIESITVNGNAATIDASTKTASVTIPEASQSTSGVMSSTDKIKLDNLETIKGIKSNEKIVSLTQDTDLLQTTLSIAIEQGSAGTADEGKTFIRLKGINNAEVSSVDASSFVIDGMLQSAEIYSYDGTTWTPSTPTGGTVPSTAGVYIRLAWNSDAGGQVSYLDVSTLIDAYTAGNGLELSANNEFSIKIDSTPGNVTLTTSANGLKASVDLSGKQDALTAGTNISINNNTVSAKGYVYDDTKQSFAEGNNVNTASGNNSHAEGSGTIASGTASHTEGYTTYNGTIIASANGAHAEGYASYGGTIKASADGAHAEGYTINGSMIIANGTASHAEGMSTTAFGASSHAEGGGSSEMLLNISSRTATTITFSTLPNGIKIGCIIKDANDAYAKVTNINTSSNTVTVNSNLSTDTNLYLVHGIAYGISSHTEGQRAASTGAAAHAEGSYTTASGNYSHAEGYNTTASGPQAHAEGGSTTASNYYSHAEGHSTTASGNYSHAEGYNTTASGDYSHTGGYYTEANQDNMTAIGKYNKTYSGDSTTTLFVVGDGAANSRHNAFEVINEVGANTSYSTRATVNGFDNVLLGMPIGSVVLWGGASSVNVPEGWLLCNGRRINVEISNSTDFDFVHSGQYFKAENVIYRPLCKVIRDYYGFGELIIVQQGTEYSILLPNIPAVVSTNSEYPIDPMPTTSNMNYIIKYK